MIGETGFRSSSSISSLISSIISIISTVKTLTSGEDGDHAVRRIGRHWTGPNSTIYWQGRGVGSSPALIQIGQQWSEAIGMGGAVGEKVDDTPADYVPRRGFHRCLLG